MTEPVARLPGVVLMGGAGRRWGGPKAEATLPDGSRFLDRAVRALAPATSEVFAGGADSPIRGLRPIRDVRPDGGPLAGIAAALGQARVGGAEGVVLLPVDLPRMTAPGVLHLLERWRGLPEPDRSVVVAADGHGPQPLAGVWGSGASEVIAAALEADRLAVHGVLDDLRAAGFRVVEVDEAAFESVCGHRRPLLNVNRPEEADLALSTPICPPIVAVQGWKNSGKTTVAERLVHRLTDRGFRVMSLKRGHGFNLDAPGTDSARLTAAGSARTVLAGPEMIAVLGARAPALGDGATALSAAWLADADVVIAEGWKSETLPAIEVRRAEARDQRPLAEGSGRDRILATVSDRAEDREAGALDLEAPETIDRLMKLVESRVMALQTDVPVPEHG